MVSTRIMEKSPGPSWVGRQLEGYQVLGALGAGGMGQVFRARDTKLGREVALKVLPEAFSEDPGRIARFQREARLLAALNHPNIATIYGLEEVEGRHVLVLELVEGETLAERLHRDPLTVREALPVFQQISEGLEAAHDKGIVHRDLKPANIAVAATGQVKLLDFGLAKASWEEIPEHAPSHSPTVSVSGTQAGAVLGTAAYMSPEQARGDALDERTDIWAFGCVLYEALTGRKAFRGRTVADTLAGVLERDVDWAALPEKTPASLRRLLRRCLEKEKHRRLRHVADARMEIEEAVGEASGNTRALFAARGPVTRRLAWQLALASAVIAGAASLPLWAWRGEAPRPAVTRFTIDLEREIGDGAGLFPGIGNPLAISPDGSHLAYVVRKAPGEPPLLYLRALDRLGSSPMVSGFSPFFSPDGRTLGFGGLDLSSVWRVPVGGGPASEVGRTLRFRNALWGSDGRLVANTRGGTWVLSASDGEAEPLLSLRDKEVHQILPGGELLISDLGRPAGDTLEIVSLESDERRSLMRARTDWARLLPAGHLIWATAEALLAVRMAAGGTAPAGEPLLVLTGLNEGVAGANPYVALSKSGTLVHAPSPGREDDALVWIDRVGKATPIPEARGRLWGPARLSPDGRRAAVVISDGPDRDIWILDLARGIRRRLTFDGHSRWPVWSPDGAWIACSQSLEEERIVRLPADGSGGAELIVPHRAAPTTWSPDGRTLAATDFGSQKIWIVTIDGETSELPAGPGRKGVSAFSPDGRWLAYSSAESGRDEVYVQPFPGPGGVTVVSSGGGRDPFWSPGGDQLFYHGPDHVSAPLFAVDLELDGHRVRVGTPRRLFEGYLGFDMAADGRFLMARESRPAPITEVRVVLNWTEELEQLLP